MKETAKNTRIQHNEESTLRGILRGEAQVHIGQIDQELPLDPDRLLKLAWACSELAAIVELRG